MLKQIPLLRRIHALNYNWKITFLLIATLFVTALLILATVSFSAGETIKSKSADLTIQRIETVAQAVETAMRDFTDMAVYIISDTRLQEYLRTPEDKAENYTQLTNNAYHLLTYLINSNSYVDYVSIYKNTDDTLLYEGKTWTIPNFKEKMKEGYNRAEGSKYGNMTILAEPDVFYPDRYSMNIYQSIQNHYSLGHEIGALLISINHASFSKIYSYDGDESIHFYITGADGRIVSAADESLIGTESPLGGRKLDERGSFEAQNHLIVYSRVEQWGWYLVGSIAMDDLLRDNRETMRFMAVVIAVICAGCAFVAYSMSNTLYRPLGELVENMAIVSGGNLSTRMDAKGRGEDIETLVNGFNDMLDHIERLMEQVKEEQRQIDQTRFNALQSQIQPHFLYNTLDCIHWQAVVDGSNEISVMVKALASYYRLCLSKGKDIIPLSQEISHVKSYLIIQNIRYGGIIESSYEVNKVYGEVMIPKMTLQPLVENAIYHGIKTKSGRTGKITIRALERKDKITVIVEDNGVGMSQSRVDEVNSLISTHDENFGYGVRNVSKRIELLFGKGYGLFYRLNCEGGVSVEISLPKEPRTEDIPYV